MSTLNYRTCGSDLQYVELTLASETHMGDGADPDLGTRIADGS
jgi:hypothetical protein